MTTWPWQGDVNGQNLIVLFLFFFSFPKQTSPLIHLSIWQITTKASGCTSLKILHLCTSSNAKFRPAAVSTRPIPWGCTNTKALFTELLEYLLIRGLLPLSVKRPMYSTSKLSISAFWFLPPPFTLFEACFCSKSDACLAAVSVALARASKWLCRDAPAHVPKAFLWAMLHQPHQTTITSALCSSTQGSCVPCQVVEQLPLELHLLHLGLYDSKTEMATDAQNVHLMLCSENANHQLCSPQMEQQGCKINGAF